MPEYQNLNKIALFHVQNKVNERGPDLTGNLDVAGIKFKVSMWRRESRNGLSYFSGEITKVEDKASGVHVDPEKRKVYIDEPMKENGPSQADGDHIPF